MEPMHAFDGFSRLGCRGDVIDDMNTPDYEHVVFKLDLPLNLSRQSVIACINFARFQRASKGANQSAACSRDDIIESGGMRLRDHRTDLVVVSYRAMNPEAHRLGFCRKISEPQRSDLALDPNLRNIDYV